MLSRRSVTPLAALLWAAPTLAHQGAPYPMLRDAPASGCKLSAWIDPDEGLGDLFFTLDCPPEISRALPEAPVRVRVRDAATDDAAAPWTGAYSDAKPDEDSPGDSYVLQVPFTHVGPWDVELTTTTAPDQPPTTQVVRVEVEPPGPARWEAAFLAIPFILVGGLWAAVQLTRRRERRRRWTESHA